MFSSLPERTENPSLPEAEVRTHQGTGSIQQTLDSMTLEVFSNLNISEIIPADLVVLPGTSQWESAAVGIPGQGTGALT